MPQSALKQEIDNHIDQVKQDKVAYLDEVKAKADKDSVNPPHYLDTDKEIFMLKYLMDGLIENGFLTKKDMEYNFFRVFRHLDTHDVEIDKVKKLKLELNQLLQDIHDARNAFLDKIDEREKQFLETVAKHT